MSYNKHFTLGQAFEVALEALNDFMEKESEKVNDTWTYTTPFEVSIRDQELVVKVYAKTSSSTTDGKIAFKVPLVSSPL